MQRLGQGRQAFLTAALLLMTSATATCTPFKDDLSGDAAFAEPRVDAGRPSSQEGDSAGDGNADTGSGCDLNKPFGPPRDVLGTTNATTQAGGLRLSRDSRTAYFHAADPAGIGPTGASWDLYTATRASPRAEFGHVAPLGDSTVNTPWDDSWPTVSGDGLTLVFTRSFGGLPRQLEYATRNTTSALFARPRPALGADDSSSSDNDAFLREDGQVLYFVSRRGTAQQSAIYRAVWNGSAFGNVVAVAQLNTTYGETAPVVTPNELTIYFSSARPPASAQSGTDIWVAHRLSVDEWFSAPTNVSELNAAFTSPQDKVSTFVGPDGCGLYFDTATPQTNAPVWGEYVTEKPPH